MAMEKTGIIVDGYEIGNITVAVNPNAPPVWNDLLRAAAAMEPVLQQLDSLVSCDMPLGVYTPEFLKEPWGVPEWKMWPNYMAMRKDYNDNGMKFIEAYRANDFETPGGQLPGVGFTIPLIALGIIVTVLAVVSVFVIREVKKPPEAQLLAEANKHATNAEETQANMKAAAQAVSLPPSNVWATAITEGGSALKWAVVAGALYVGYKVFYRKR